MGKTYAFLEVDNPREIICAFTVSNASIFTNLLPNARRKRIGKDVPEQEKLYRHITAPGQLHTRLMFFDLMQITPAATAAETA